jgi:unsaturated chondroitin disaccharide hydrolase
MVKDKGWPHNTIIDNMMNLELLFWASKNGPNKNLYNIAVQHARTTMENQFHDDIAYHVVVYDTITGKKLKGITHQGLSDESMWARGQAWAIYGYTMVYRETKEPEFLDFAVRLTEQYLRRLPDDYIPYWDFDDAPKGPKDASAAAITASALLELSRYVDEEKGNKYNEIAELTLTALGSPMYESREINSAFLLHSTGHMPNGSEVDASIIYADYYYLEALLRLKNQRAQVASR